MNTLSGQELLAAGLALQAQGRIDEAREFYNQSVKLQPNLAAGWANLALICRAKGQMPEALMYCQRAVGIDPDSPEICSNYGLILDESGQGQLAIQWLQRAVQLRPNIAQAFNNLGNAFQRQGSVDQAIKCYEKSASLQPNSPEVHNNLAILMTRSGRFDEALLCYKRALSIRPGSAEISSNLAMALKDVGRLDEALAYLDRARQSDPACVDAHSNWLYTLHFHPSFGPADLLREHRRWDELFARSLTAAAAPLVVDRTPDRRLRIGYVSPDFREHVVARFLLPLLARHDRERFEIFCYADVARADAVTERVKSFSDHWRHTLGMSDEDLASLVRRDHIDILVDLTMHMAGNRLLMFARKPAPVQVTYLAYCSTTGLSAMDYRLTDPYLDPPGTDLAACYTEKSVVLPGGYWCYQPHASAPALAPLPALKNGFITFGCLNNFAKISAGTTEAWAAVLRSTPSARLVVHCGTGTHREQYLQRMSRLGVNTARIRFVGFMTVADYFAEYQNIDIALDPFPYGGGTTTCDALWMGVPVITLRGPTAVSRAGLSILSSVGYPQWVATTREQYIANAVTLAGDLAGLTQIRRTLRETMQRSALTDDNRFAREMETAYRMMWVKLPTAR